MWNCGPIVRVYWFREMSRRVEGQLSMIRGIWVEAGNVREKGGRMTWSDVRFYMVLFGIVGFAVWSGWVSKENGAIALFVVWLLRDVL